MITLVASDLHVGDSKSGHLDFYNFLVSRLDIDRVIIAGDFFDLWVASAGRVLKEGQYLLDYLTCRFNKNIIYLTGNHDEDFKYIRYLNGLIVKQFHSFECKSKRILICHGHQYDSNFYVKQMEGIARINAFLVNIVDKLFGIDIRKILVSMSERIENNPYNKILETFENNLKHEFEDVHDVIITGHTHIPKLKQLGSLLYANCGDTLQHRTALLIDEERCKISLIAYDGDAVKTVDEVTL